MRKGWLGSGDDLKRPTDQLSELIRAICLIRVVAQLSSEMVRKQLDCDWAKENQINDLQRIANKMSDNRECNSLDCADGSGWRTRDCHVVVSTCISHIAVCQPVILSDRIKK